MNYTLDICGNSTIENPTEAVIRQAVFALDTKKRDAYLILGPTGLTYIQVTGDPKVGFELEYQEENLGDHFRAQRDFTASEIAQAFVEYSIGSDNWKKSTEWARITV